MNRTEVERAWAERLHLLQISHDPKTLAPMTFIVEWDDQEGNRHELSFPEAKYEDALLEAEALKEKFDYVNIRVEE